jgi:hypothetical protein
MPFAPRFVFVCISAMLLALRRARFVLNRDSSQRGGVVGADFIGDSFILCAMPRAGGTNGS